MKDLERDNILKDIYNDFLTERNKYKIEIDNYQTEIEIINRQMEYYKNEEDESKIFSPRENENRGIDSYEKLENERDELEIMIEDLKEKFKYYSDYCNRMKSFFSEENDESVKSVKEIWKTERTVDENINEDIVYNLNLNYDNGEIENKLSRIINKMELCLKISDKDQERTKRELKTILTSLKKLKQSVE